MTLRKAAIGFYPKIEKLFKCLVTLSNTSKEKKMKKNFAILIACAMITMPLCTLASADISLGNSKISVPGADVVELKDSSSKTKKAKKKEKMKREVKDAIIRLSEDNGKDNAPVRTAKVSESEVQASTSGAKVEVKGGAVKAKVKE
jgi:hypothetical protein